MIIPETFHFLRPAWLCAFLPLAAILWLLVRRRLGSRGWEAVCEPALLPHVLIAAPPASRRVPFLLAAAAGTIAIFALAGPAWRQLPQPLYSSGGALVIALDLSRSMDANDLEPSRLARARFKVADILALHREGQTALLVFAGDAFTVTPLTDDVETIRSQLGALSTDIMPAPGSRADKALLLAGDLLRQAGLDHGDVLLITDEADGVRPGEEARRLHRSGFRVSVLGAGTERGAPVPLPGGGFLKSGSGEIVIPRLDEAPLREVAAAGGGVYTQLAIDDSDLATLAGVLASRITAETSRSEFRADAWRDEGPWLVLLLLPLAALAFRRGYLFVLPLLLALPPQHADAFGWDDLWLRPDQQGQRALDSGDAARAAQLFGEPERKGAAQYRAGDFESSADTWAQTGDREALYNRGNALARLGRFDEAIAAYDEVLKADPSHEDARYNKELLEKQQQQQQQSGSGQSQQDTQAENQGDPGQDTQAGDPSGGGEPGEEEQRAADGDPPSGSESGQPDQAARSGDSERDDSAQSSSRETQDGGKPAEQKSGEAQGREQEGDQQPESATAARSDTEPLDEEQLAAEQWLRRIPDDPGGLLRRKFRYQYQQRAQAPAPEDKTW